VAAYQVIVEPGFWDKLAAIGTAVAFVAVAITLVFSVLGQRATRAGQKLIEAGQKQEREIAENTAARSEAAARLSSEYSERIVAALEAIARSGIGTATGPARVRWQLLHESGATYRVTNIGDLPAYGVTISSDPSLPLINVPQGNNIGPDEAVIFLASPDLNTRDMTVTAAWNDADGAPADIWRYPLPT
jgi:hypothetical protein